MLNVIADVGSCARLSYGKWLGGPVVGNNGGVYVFVMAKVWDAVVTIWSVGRHNPTKMRFALANRWRPLPVEAGNESKISGSSQEHHITVRLMGTRCQSERPSVSLSSCRPIVWLQRSWMCLPTSYYCEDVRKPENIHTLRTRNITTRIQTKFLRKWPLQSRYAEQMDKVELYSHQNCGRKRVDQKRHPEREIFEVPANTVESVRRLILRSI